MYEYRGLKMGMLGRNVYDVIHLLEKIDNWDNTYTGLEAVIEDIRHRCNLIMSEHHAKDLEELYEDLYLLDATKHDFGTEIKIKFIYDRMISLLTSISKIVSDEINTLTTEMNEALVLLQKAKQ